MKTSLFFAVLLASAAALQPSNYFVLKKAALASSISQKYVMSSVNENQGKAGVNEKQSKAGSCSVSLTWTANRRDLFSNFLLPASAVLATTVALPFSARAKRPACGDIDSCRALGQAKFDAAEAERGPIVRLGNGVSYRELRQGTGDEQVVEGSVLDLAYMVLRGDGFYMYSLGFGKEPSRNDLGETYRAVVGAHDVPVAVERALLGARRGAVRRVEVPPSLGFATSAWRPAPDTFEGRQRIEAYRKVCRSRTGKERGGKGGVVRRGCSTLEPRRNWHRITASTCVVAVVRACMSNKRANACSRARAFVHVHAYHAGIE